MKGSRFTACLLHRWAEISTTRPTRREIPILVPIAPDSRTQELETESGISNSLTQRPGSNDGSIPSRRQSRGFPSRETWKARPRP